MTTQPGQRRPSLTGESSFTLLKTLNTFTPRFNLYVRVTDRSPMTEFVNKRTSATGYIFNVTVLDAEGICMNCKFWNGAAQKYDSRIQKDSILKMSNVGKIVVANKRYSSVEHNYELSIDSADADITVCDPVSAAAAGDNPDKAPAEPDLPVLPKAPTLATCKFSNLRSVFLNANKLPYFGSIIGIIHDVQPVRNVQLRRPATPGATEPTTANVRNLLVVDPTKHSIDVTLWGNLCDQHPYDVGDVIYLLNIQLKQNNKNTGAIQAATVRSSDIHLNSDQHPFTEQYKQWYKDEGSVATYKPLSDTGLSGSGDAGQRTIIDTDLKGMQEYLDTNDQIDDSQGVGGGVLFRIPYAFVTDIAYRRLDDSSQYNVVYNACVSCNKKMTEQGNCPNCQGDSSIPKLSLNISLSDQSASNIQMRCFTDQAQVILGRQPRQIKDLIETNNANDIKDIMEFNALWKRYNFVIRARKELYNNSLRLSMILSNLQPINHNTQIAQTMKAITQLLPDAFDYQQNEETIKPPPGGDVKRLKVDL